MLKLRVIKNHSKVVLDFVPTINIVDLQVFINYQLFLSNQDLLPVILLTTHFFANVKRVCRLITFEKKID